MKYTLLKIVTEYMDRTSGFYVNSIFESDESQQIANIAESVFYDLVEKVSELKSIKQLTVLDHIGDVNKPNYLRVPSKIYDIHKTKISYKVGSGKYVDLQYLEPNDFLALDYTTPDSVIVTDSNGIEMLVPNLKTPEYFTSFDDVHIVCDSYDSEVETTLMAAKTRVWASLSPVFLVEDNFIIPLPEHLQRLYADMVMKECYEALREELAPMSIQQRVKVGLAKLQQKNQVTGSPSQRRVNYGRRV